MNTPGPEKNFQTVIIIAAVALTVGSIAGYVGFGSLIGTEHAMLGARAGALISQVLVWGSLIFVGLAHWTVEGYHALRGNSTQAQLPTMTVAADQFERPITTEAAPAARQPARHEEVAV